VSHPVDPVSLEASPPGSSARVVLAREGNEIALLYYELSATPAKGNSREGACPLAFLSGENLEAAAISFLWGEAVSRERSLSAVNGRFQADPGDRGEERSLLSLVRPNPFTNETVISFAIQNPTLVSLDVFSVEGRRIRTLVRDRIGSGLHRVEWDGRDSAGRQVASGIYFLRIHAGDLRETRRIVLLR
jgi:hypothetical protein